MEFYSLHPGISCSNAESININYGLRVEPRLPPRVTEHKGRISLPFTPQLFPFYPLLFPHYIVLLFGNGQALNLLSRLWLYRLI